MKKGLILARIGLVTAITFTCCYISAFSGEIQGTVLSSADSNKLSGVKVQLLENGQKKVTNKEGKFAFLDLQSGDYTLLVISLGYRTMTIKNLVVSEEQVKEIKINLEKIEFLFNEILVVGQALPKAISRQSLQGLEIKRLPGATGDALKAIQSLPGIRAANDFSGQLFVRGGGPEDNTIYFDRFPLEEAYHFGGLVSTVSSEILNRIDVYAGGFGAEYGRDAQAVVDVHSRQGNRKKFSSNLHVNFLYSEGLIEGPIGDRGSWYLAGRRSYADVVYDLLPIPKSDVITALPRFWDYQTKLSYDINEMFQLDLNAFASDDFAQLKLGKDKPDDDLSGAFYLKNSFHLQGVHLRSILTPNIKYDLNVSHSKRLINFKIGKGFYLRIQPTDIDVRHDLTYKITPRFQIESGLNNNIGRAMVQTFFPRPPEEGEPNFDFRLSEKVQSNQRNKGYEVEGYLQGRFKLTNFFSTTLGMRFDYARDLTGQIAVQPRTSFNLLLPLGSEIRFAYGRYMQSPQPWQAYPPSGNPNLDETTAHHFVLEIEREVGVATELKFATYYKQLKNQIESVPDQNPSYLNLGAGYARGSEILLQHRQGNKLFGWISYANSVSKRRDSPDQPYRFYDYDQTHVATITASYQISKNWEIGAKWQYASGNPYTPLTCEENVKQPCAKQVFNNNRWRQIPIYGEINSFRYDPFHRLDIRINKDFIFSSWKMSLYLELLNAYNRKNILTFDYDENYARDEKGNVIKDIVSQLPIVPYIGIKSEF